MDKNKAYEKDQVIHLMQSALPEIYLKGVEKTLNLSQSKHVQNILVELMAMGKRVLACDDINPIQNNYNMYMCQNYPENRYSTGIMQQMLGYLLEKPEIYKNTMVILFKYKLDKVAYIIQVLETHIKELIKMMGSNINICFGDIVLDKITTGNLYYMMETLTYSNISYLKDKILTANARTYFDYNDKYIEGYGHKNNIDYIHSLMSMLKLDKRKIDYFNVALQYKQIKSDGEPFFFDRQFFDGGQCVDDEIYTISMVPQKDQFKINLYRNQIVNNQSKTVKYYFESSSTSPKGFYIFSYEINLKNQEKTMDDEALKMLDLLFIKIKAVIAHRETYQLENFFNLKK